MEDFITEDGKFVVSAENSSFAARCKVIAQKEDGFVAKVLVGNLPEFGSCDIFAPMKNGLLFCKSEISANNDGTVEFLSPRDVENLQRREYSRIKPDKNILIDDNGDIIRARIINISAGGMKILTNKKIDIGHEVNVNFSLNKNTAVNCTFMPLAQSADENDETGFIISGKFTDMKPSDTIILCRYCAMEILKRKSLRYDDKNADER